MTLDEILKLVGHLDDTPGFDGPRERYRRFLLEHVRDATGVGALIAQCQFVPGEQHQRALNDLVVLLGRCLGFALSFETASRPAEWRSPARLRLNVHVCATAIDRASLRSDEAASHLFVVTSPHANPVANQDAVASTWEPVRIKIVGLRTLLSLAAMMTDARISHDDVVRLLDPKAPVEFIVTLLERASQPRTADEPAAREDSQDQMSFWLATVAPDHGTMPAEFLELVVGRRHIFGVAEQNGSESGTARAGDFLCFHIPGPGVVGHARILAVAAGAGGMRDARHYRQLLHLDRIDLHLDAPMALDAETLLRVRAATPAVQRHAHTIIRISRESFELLTSLVIGENSQ